MLWWPLTPPHVPNHAARHKICPSRGVSQLHREGKDVTHRIQIGVLDAASAVRTADTLHDVQVCPVARETSCLALKPGLRIVFVPALKPVDNDSYFPH